MQNDHNREAGAEEHEVFSAIDYAHLVAWPERIRREAPFLLRILAGAPGREILDLGCGPGGHSRFLAQSGYEVLGIDRSQSMIAKARESVQEPNPRFKQGLLEELESLVTGTFAGAISLGNTLVSIKTEAGLLRAFKGLWKVLRPKGVFLFQILNYQRIFEGNIRYLPLNFIKETEGETIFLRLMKQRDDGMVLFCPTTLHFDPEDNPPTSIMKSKTVELRGWRLSEIRPLLEQSGFESIGVFGDMKGGMLQPSESSDLVVLASRKTI